VPSFAELLSKKIYLPTAKAASYKLRLCFTLGANVIHADEPKKSPCLKKLEDKFHSASGLFTKNHYPQKIHTIQNDSPD